MAGKELMMNRAFFIDVDNTLLDFDAYVVSTMQKGFQKFSLKSFELWMYEVFVRENNMLWEKLENGLLTFEELQKIRWNTIFDKIGIDFDGITFERYFREELHDSAIPVEGSCQLLESLKNSGFILCVASNGPYEQQMNRLHISGMDQYFDYFFISEEIGASKPSVEFFSESFKRLNEDRTAEDKIIPEKCIILGDSFSSDMQGGKNYGMHTAFFSRGKEQPEENEKNRLWDEWFMTLEDVRRKYNTCV